ncbi:VOC family protein [Aminipila sp.]|uniref:VOC family protein n=1 Tax=Aminipila sp. TaxID=2060095 RepID=UPI0028A1BEFB|nr:VOC family protein [Aminipila sp.]
MTIGVEIDFIVEDSLAALNLYERIFDIECIEVTDFPKGQNEAVFTIYGVRFHMLDANPEFGMLAPNPEIPQTIWFNVLVPDIKKLHQAALDAGCMEIQPVTEMKDYGVINSMFTDPFGYQWMLHQIEREVSFEERVQLWKKHQETEYE